MTRLLLPLLIVLSIVSAHAQNPATPRQLDPLGSPNGNRMKGIRVESYFGLPVNDTLTLNNRPDSIGGLMMLRSNKGIYKYEGGGTWRRVDGAGSGDVLTRTYVGDGQHDTVALYTGFNKIASVQVTTRNGSGMQSWYNIADSTYILYAHAPQDTVIYKMTVVGAVDTTGLQGLATPFLHAESAGQTQIALHWNTIDSAVAYSLEKSYDSLDFGIIATLAPDDTAFLDTGLVAGQPYYYRLRAVGDYKYRSSSSFSYASAMTDALAALQSPSLHAQAISPDSIVLTWNSVAYTNGYVLQYATDTLLSWDDLPLGDPLDTVYVHTPLNPNTTYYYRIRALTGDTAHSDSYYTTTGATTFPQETTADVLPQPNLTATTASTTQINLTWTAVDSASGYALQRSPDNSAWTTLATFSTAVTSFNNTGLVANTKYYYRIQALGDGVNFLNSAYDLDSATTNGLTPLVAPALTATANATDSANLSWANVANETGYQLDYSTDNTTWVTFAQVAANSTAIVHRSLNPNTIYYYRITALGDGITYSNSPFGTDTAKTKAVVIQPQTLPTPSMTARVDSLNPTTAINLFWTAVTGATGYGVERSVDSLSWTALTTFSAATLQYSDGGRSPNTKYFYRIRALGNGTTTLNSAYGFASARTNPITTLGTPKLTASPASSSQITLFWTAVPNTLNYELQYSLNKTTWTPLANPSSSATTFAHTGLTASTKYYYRIRAVGDGVVYATGAYALDSATTNSPPPVQLATPVLSATPVSPTQINLSWTNVANESSYVVERSLNGSVWDTLVKPAANVATYNNTGLVASTQYSYRIRAIGNGTQYLNSNLSNTAVATTNNLTTLATPSLAASPTSDVAIHLSWTNIANESSYQLEYSLNKTTWTVIASPAVDVIAFDHTGLTPSTKYYYRIKGVGNHTTFGDSPYDMDSATTNNATPPPADTLNTPSLTATTAGTQQVTLTWTNVANESSFGLERSLDKKAWTVIANPAANILTYSDNGLTASTKYYYRIRAIGDGVTHFNSLYDVDSATTNALTILALPNLSFPTIGTNQIGIAWTNVANESGYLLQYSLNKTTWTTLTNAAVNVTSYTHNGLTPNTKYYYRVQATGDNASFANSPFDLDSATTVASAVTLQTPALTALGVSTTQINLSWTDVTGESSYELQRSLDSASWTVIATPTADVSSFSNTGLKAATKYYYRIRAIGDGVNFLNSGFRGASAVTDATASQSATKFGILSVPDGTNLQQWQLSTRTADSLGMPLVRSQVMLDNTTNPSSIISSINAGKEVFANINHFPSDGTRNFTLDNERAAYVTTVNNLFRNYLVGKNDTVIAVGNEECNLNYRDIDTAVNSPTNSARLYFMNEFKVVDSIAKVVGPNQFKTCNGGLTGKPMWWIAWKNLRDSGRYADADELAYQIFLPGERKGLADWETSGPEVMQIKMMKQLITYYQQSDMDYINLHIKLPMNGVDSSHLDPRIFTLTVQAYKNIMCRPVVSNEIAERNITPALTSEIAQAAAREGMPYICFYDGLSFTTTLDKTAEADVCLRSASDLVTLNNIGRLLKQTLKNLKTGTNQ